MSESKYIGAAMSQYPSVVIFAHPAVSAIRQLSVIKAFNFIGNPFGYLHVCQTLLIDLAFGLVDATLYATGVYTKDPRDEREGNETVKLQLPSIIEPLLTTSPDAHA